ncbi:MAG: 50S ribosomal protein L3 [archaeon]|nr:50S ribosomal protein L3 [archaeon]
MTARRPRWGSLQFYPRKRAAKFLPSVNWSNQIAFPSKEDGILGFITYKAGMATAVVKDNTDKSMTQNKKIAIPVTILEAPDMKIFSVRFYKNNLVIKDIIVSADKELKRIVRVPKTLKSLDTELPKHYDDIRIIAYSLPKDTSIKKTPDLIELAVNSKDKLAFIRSLIGKQISLKDFLKFDLFDIRGLTRGKGLVGPVKRFGLGLKGHKSEKGVRRPGSLGPWHPARVTFRTPMAGQMGMFSRVIYNVKSINSGNIKEKNINPSQGFKHYGKIRTNYILVKGSVHGPVKRQILLTPAVRPTKESAKKKYEFLELIQ